MAPANVEGRFVCGIQPVREAIRAHGAKVTRVLIEGGDAPQLEALARFAKDQGIKVERAPRAELDVLAQGARHQGVCAFAPPLTVLDLDDVPLEPTSLFIVLDELEDPQNFGAVVRSAVGLGASAVVFPEHHAAPLTAAMFRASAGAVEHARLVRVAALQTALARLAAEGATVVGLDASSEENIDALPLGEGPVVLVVGAEGKGLRRPVKQACTHVARLPMAKSIGSLNASVAAAIALYEVVRQRRSSSA